MSLFIGFLDFAFKDAFAGHSMLDPNPLSVCSYLFNIVQHFAVDQDSSRQWSCG